MNPFQKRGHLTTDELSACLDGRGSDRGHLAGCETCRADLASLEATRAYLRSMREVPAPHSFMPLAQEPARPRWSWFPAMRMATAGAAVLLLLSVGLETYVASGRTASAPSIAVTQQAYQGQEKAASDSAGAPAAAPLQGAQRSAPEAAPRAVTPTSVPVPQEVLPTPAPIATTGPGSVTPALGVIFVLLFAATIGLWIRERSH